MIHFIVYTDLTERNHMNKAPIISKRNPLPTKKKKKKNAFQQ